MFYKQNRTEFGWVSYEVTVFEKRKGKTYSADEPVKAQAMGSPLPVNGLRMRIENRLAFLPLDKK
jgi:hypothetical protein